MANDKKEAVLVSTEGDLRKETKDCPLVVRSYDTDDKGTRRFQEEAAILAANGYSPRGSRSPCGAVPLVTLSVTLPQVAVSTVLGSSRTGKPQADSSSYTPDTSVPTVTRAPPGVPCIREVNR